MCGPEVWSEQTIKYSFFSPSCREVLNGGASKDTKGNWLPGPDEKVSTDRDGVVSERSRDRTLLKWAEWALQGADVAVYLQHWED